MDHTQALCGLIGARAKPPYASRSGAQNLRAPVGVAGKIFADFSLVTALEGVAHRYSVRRADPTGAS